MCRLACFVLVMVSLVLAVVSVAAAGENPTTLSLTPGDAPGVPKVTIIDQTARGMTLQLDIPSVDLFEVEVGGRPFATLALDGAEVVGDLGRAGLPVYTRLVALPVGAAARVTVTGRQMASLPAMTLAPVQAELEPGKAAPAFAFDAAWYGRASRTEVTASAGEPGLMRGVRVVPVSISPVSYDPATGEISVARTMTIEVDFTGRDTRNNPTGPARLIPESFANIFEDAVVGYVRGDDVATGPGSYLYICPNNAAVTAALQPLVNWRARQGYRVVVATTAEAGTTSTAIKAFIQAAYNTYDPPLEFVTLVGDAAGTVGIPCWREGLSGYNGEGDLDYGLLEGGDVLVDVHVGRLSVTSTAELTTVVNKLVGYESDPDLTDPTWFTTAGLTGDPSSSGYSCIWVNQFVKESLQDLSYTRIDTIWSGNFVSQMLATINQGESLFTYRGYWNMSGMTYSHIQSTTNGRQLPFAVILTCDTGSFATDATCRSEAFLRAPNGGGMAAIGTATTGTHTRYNNCMFLGITHGVLNTAEHRVGPALTRGKLNLYTNYIANEPQQVQVWSHWNNLMGDPATEMWTGVPQVLTVTHAAQLNALANAVPVTVTRGGQPVVGALVAAYQLGTVRATGYTDGSGNVLLPITGVVNGALQVTVTGHNLKPYLGSVAIGAVTSSLDFAALTVTEASGNGNGVPNPGESLLLNLQLANHGSASLTNVSATLSCPLPWVHLTTGTRSYGTVAGGGSAWSQGAYAVSLDADAPGGQAIPLRLDATSGSQTWTSLIYLTPTGPRALFNRITFSGPGGNLDPGESGNLAVEISNVGNQNTAGVTATIACTSPWVTVTDATGAWGAIAVGVTTPTSNPFAISVASDCYPGHLANFTVHLQYAEGGTGTVEFTQVIGTAVVGNPTGPDAYGYYIFDNADPDANAPTYNWFDIAAIGQNAGVADNGTYGDDTRDVNLPFAFTMYGQTHNRISVCSNGWLAMGHTYQRMYRNWHLPADGGPGDMICAFWDDLAMGVVYTYHDVANHRFIVQWEGYRSESGSGYTGNCTFQIILYDPAYHATPTGDGPIEIMYESVSVYGDETTYFTTGLQNGDRTTGITYAYGNHYAGGAAALAAGRALRIVPVVPQAQGTLSGQVTNASAGGAPLPGATVTVIGANLQLTSGANGHYEGGVPVGTWDLAVYHASCAPDTVRDVAIQANLGTAVNFSLVDIAGPAFAGTTQLPDTIDPAGPYPVETTITDITGLAERHLYYTSSTTGGPFELPLTVVNPATGLVSGQIPGQVLGSRVQYWFTARDLVGNDSQEPAGAPWPTYSFQVSQPTQIASDTMETDTGWQVNVGGTDGATTGLWTRVDPNTVVNAAGGYNVVPGDDHTPAPGVLCWVTGQDAEGAVQGGQDVDGGATTLYRPIYNLAAYSAVTVSYWRWYTNDTGSSPGADTWRVQVTDNGTDWVDLEATMTSERAWVQKTFAVGSLVDLTATVRFRFIADDAGSGSIVEALVDDFVLTASNLIADATAPTVMLTYPNGGEVFEANDEVMVAWSASDDLGIVQARVYLDVSGQPLLLAAGALNGTYRFVWSEHYDVVPQVDQMIGRFRVVVLDGAERQAGDSSDGDVTFSYATPVEDLPAGRFQLAQNNPNPFNPRTEIRFEIPRTQDVSLRIYDVRGQLVRTLVQGMQPAGVSAVVWSGEDDRGDQAASGLYFYRLVTDDGEQTRKMLLLK